METMHTRKLLFMNEIIASGKVVRTSKMIIAMGGFNFKEKVQSMQIIMTTDD